MDTKFETMAEYILSCLKTEQLSAAAVYEFTSECYQITYNAVQIQWRGSVEALWNYLSAIRTSIDSADQNVSNIFKQGQIFTALELIKIMQENKNAADNLATDANLYAPSWKNVFKMLSIMGNMTHKELAQAIGKSESSLSQFMQKIESKHYVICRKVGRTKYYRLSSKGQQLLNLMPTNQNLSKTKYAIRKNVYRDFNDINDLYDSHYKIEKRSIPFYNIAVFRNDNRPKIINQIENNQFGQYVYHADLKKYDSEHKKVSYV